MPERLRLLYATTLGQRGEWLRSVLEHDGACDVRFDEAVGVASAMARLREEVYDIVLVAHSPGVLDGLSFVEGLRAADHDLAAIVLGSDETAEIEALALESGADAYCCTETTTTRTLLWVFARAINHRELLAENRRLVESQRQRLASEHAEAQRLLAQQRGLVEQLEQIQQGVVATDDSSESNGPADSPSALVPEDLRQRYRDMLQTYVVMGTGSLADEMSRLVDRCAARGVSARGMMQMHVDVLETMVVGLGNRSARHVMTRADLLLVELVVHLADAYRARYNDRLTSEVQRWLPGFDDSGLPLAKLPSAA